MSFLHDTTHFGSHLDVYLCSSADTANIFFHLETPINQLKFIELDLKKLKKSFLYDPLNTLTLLGDAAFFVLFTFELAS